MKKTFFITTLALMLTMMISANPAATAELGLVRLLTQNLGVTTKQATGGAGSIFNVAKQKMTTEDFTQLAKAVPGINKMIAAAPKTKSATSLLGGASSLIGGSTSSLTGIAGLAGNFSKLGMKPEMVNSFLPIVLDYVKAKGGEPLMNIVQSALR